MAALEAWVKLWQLSDQPNHTSRCDFIFNKPWHLAHLAPKSGSMPDLRIPSDTKKGRPSRRDHVSATPRRHSTRCLGVVSTHHFTHLSTVNILLSSICQVMLVVVVNSPMADEQTSSGNAVEGTDARQHFRITCHLSVLALSLFRPSFNRKLQNTATHLFSDWSIRPQVIHFVPPVVNHAHPAKLVAL